MYSKCFARSTRLAAFSVALLVVALGLERGRRSDAAPEKADSLPSWNDGAAKQNILKFVAEVTKEGGPKYVPPEDRVSTFDNDGTLWSEQPVYFQALFVRDRLKMLAEKNPEWKEKQPFKAVLENDLEALAALGEKGIVELIGTTHAGMSTEEFTRIAKDWLTTAKHPRFKRPYTDLVYQPMLELLAYLRANGFKTFIVSGGGIEFIRAFADKVYGIPPEQVVGSSIVTKFAWSDGKPILLREPKVQFVDDKEGKPVGIQAHIGRRPLAAFGNSDGDLEMLQWTTAGRGPRFGLLVHHTDGVREWAYDRKSLVGRLDKALDAADKEGWTVVDMKKDWKVIYPFQK
ncbi:MAG TPA: HAD family hydrolase [Gemmataceae bacterium]|jgi:phosphoserine phosphatase